MNHASTLHRRRAQRGGAAHGVLVLGGLVGALALQVAGPQLQCRLASLVGIARIAPSPLPAGMATPMPVHGVKVAQVVASAACAGVPAI